MTRGLCVRPGVVYSRRVQIGITERTMPQIRCQVPDGLEHLKLWTFLTPDGEVPALIMWGCWDQGPWAKA